MPFRATYVNNVLDATFRAAGLTITSCTLSLHTADPGGTGASEVTGGSYARKAITMAAASAGADASNADIVFTNMPAVTVTHAAIWTNGGTCVWDGALTASKTLNAGDTFTIPSGSLTAAFA